MIVASPSVTPKMLKRNMRRLLAMEYQADRGKPMSSRQFRRLRKLVMRKARRG